MPALISCLVTKALIPWIEREVGPEGVAAILETSGRSREYLIASRPGEGATFTVTLPIAGAAPAAEAPGPAASRRAGT